MSLPNVTAPLFKLILPSTQKEVHFRPFLVKEEKVLLMAKEAEDEESIITATIQILENCTNGELDIKSLPSFDIEYLFLNIRAKSVGEEIELRYRHSGGVNRDGVECKTSTPVVVNIEEVKVKFNENHTNKIMLTEKVGIQMKYPTIGVLEGMIKKNLNDVIEIIVDCIEFLFDEEQIYDRNTTTREEFVEFIEGLSQEQLEKINTFFDTMPQIEHEIEYTCGGCGQKDKLTLKGLTDFF